MRLPLTAHTSQLPTTAHTSQPWRIHEIAGDFHVEDVWALPTPGGPDDFPRLLRPGDLAADPTRGSSASSGRCSRSAGRSGSCSAGTSRRRAPAPEWRRCATGCRRICATARPRPELAASLPFRSLYLTDDEWAAEIANRTMHGVMHLGWVPDGTGGYRGQMAVLVKPNGLLGRAYMAAILPVPAPHRVPADARRDRAAMARSPARAGARPRRVILTRRIAS